MKQSFQFVYQLVKIFNFLKKLLSVNRKTKIYLKFLKRVWRGWLQIELILGLNTWKKRKKHLKMLIFLTKLKSFYFISIGQLSKIWICKNQKHVKIICEENELNVIGYLYLN
ncbi:hypothetical protein TTHERM_000429759 (macronuclear) [Tetrahymena thermophila SB210]|uniref:Uncharacterized protein n=1 Tax=Tetrahymena thermophila (strain SB210) TaxID=312017 RepID=W7XF67_TETTS|nr:hypothetical protein TTHERM_000429759 [Tetrahymena thermophila SB210]EWS72626.1 hypothetical protein TTHERM_000429759 [Tetrahymena thermophila SB210]|eukprot:XP_012654909.1 hypothetical protein TTHERM_000429759 [Tetrahymena thermophila SB210]